MSVDVAGIDHVYVTVSDLPRAETFYDRAMGILGFRKKRSTLGGDVHVHYYNRHFGFSLRPARTLRAHDPYSPGLHHFCFRVNEASDVDRAYQELLGCGINATAPRLHPEYAPDYYALFFEDPDGIRLEVTNFRVERRRRMANWDCSDDA
jgi:glyoxylase I family protein